MIMTKAANVVGNCLMLPLSVADILPTNINVGEEMPDVMLKLESRKARLKCCLETRALASPTLLIFRRIERQRDKPLQLRRNKRGCGAVC